MDRESVERLRFDRRLLRRRGWVEDGDYEAHLEALPDVSSKMTTGAEEEGEENQCGELGGERFGRGDTDFGPRVGIQDTLTFPGNRGPDDVDNAQ